DFVVCGTPAPRLTSNSRMAPRRFDRAEKRFFGLFLSQFAQAAFQKTLLRFLASESQGPFVGRAGIGVSRQAAEHLGTSGVSEMVVRQIAASEDAVDECEPDLGAIPHGNRDGTIQFDDRRRAGLIE